jgi:hypothetical protein
MRRDLQDKCNILEGNHICEGLAARAKGYGKQCRGLGAWLRRENILEIRI